MTVLPTDLPPFGGLRSPRGHLPLDAMDVRAEITGLLVATRVRQTFENVLDEPIEATYVFPLPDRAGVTSFVAVLGGRRVEGLLKERQAARDEYDAAVAAGHRTAILEEDRPGVFSVRVGNLLAGERAEIELVLTGPLSYDEGRASFRFPLVVAPRYVPGEPLEGQQSGEGVALDTDLVPDASRISPPVLLPGQPNPVALSLEVALDPLGLELTDVRTTLPAVRTPSGIVVQPGERLDRDFVLGFRLAGAVPASAVATAPDEPDGEEGTYAVTVVPPASTVPASTAAAAPLDVAVVLDRSGSMAGWKMVAARRAVARIVDALATADRLVALGFDDRIEYPDALGDAFVPATDRNRFAAVSFLSRLEARGGTDLHRAVEQAAEALIRAGSPPSSSSSSSVRRAVLLLVTDGQVAQEDVVLAALAPYLDRVRIFTVGIDQAANAGFLNRLADAGGGRSELVESEDALDEAMSRIHRAVSPPVIRDLRVALEGATALPGTATPDRAPDCFRGAPCVLRGRYRGQPRTAVLTGTLADGSPWREVVETFVTRNPAVRTVWARAHVRALEDRYTVNPADDLAAEIVRVSLAHHVLSRFTAFVAVDRSATTNSTAPLPVIQPVEMPAGWLSPGSSMAAPMAMPVPTAGAPAPVGAAAVLRRAATKGPVAPSSDDVTRRLRDVLERVEALAGSGSTPPAPARDRLADELDDLDGDLSQPSTPAGVREAVAELARAIRSWHGVAEWLRAVRDALAARKRRRFWR